MAWLAKTARLDVSDAALESRWLSADAATRERALIVLTASAQRLLEAGVVVTVEAWLELTEIERVALTLAGRRLTVERATIAAQAARSPLDAARLFAEIDGGQAHDELALDDAMRAALDGYGGQG